MSCLSGDDLNTLESSGYGRPWSSGVVCTFAIQGMVNVVNVSLLLDTRRIKRTLSRRGRAMAELGHYDLLITDLSGYVRALRSVKQSPGRSDSCRDEGGYSIGA